MKRQQVSALHHLTYGQRIVPGREDFESAWKAVKALATGRGALTNAQKLCLLGRMSAIGTPPDVMDEVMAWNERSHRPATLLARVRVRPGSRWGTAPWMIYEGLSVAMAESDLPLTDMDEVRAVAKRMHVAPESVDALAQFCRDEAAIRRQRISMLSTSEFVIHVDQL